MWSEQTDPSEVINGYTIFPKKLTEEYKKDTNNYKRAISAVHYFENEMEEDLLVKEIVRIGAKDEFYNIEQPDDFFYKIDISKGEDYQIRTPICVAILTLNSHSFVTNYYRRIVSDKGEPVLQKYIGPIMSSDKGDRQRILYSYTTNSIFRLQAFIYLKSVRNYSNTTILNLLGHVTGTTEIIDLPHQRPLPKTPTQNETDAIKIAEVQTDLLQIKAQLPNFMQLVTQSINNMESNFSSQLQYLALENYDEKLEIYKQQQLQSQSMLEYAEHRNTVLINKIAHLNSLHESLKKDLANTTKSRTELQNTLKTTLKQLQEIDEESVLESKKISEIQEQQATPQKVGLLARIFGGNNPTDTKPTVIEVKDFKTAKGAIQSHIATIEASLQDLENEIARLETELSNLKEDAKYWNDEITENDKLKVETKMQLTKILPQQIQLLEQKKERVQNNPIQLNAAQQIESGLMSLLETASTTNALEEKKEPIK